MSELHGPRVVHQRFKVTIECQPGEGRAMPSLGMVIVGAPGCIISPSPVQARRDKRVQSSDAGIQRANRIGFLRRRDDPLGEVYSPI